jgi:hypothetical protein
MSEFRLLRRSASPLAKSKKDQTQELPIAAGLHLVELRVETLAGDSVIAVIGEKEVASDIAEVIDVAADFRGAVARGVLVSLLARTYADRAPEIAWPISHFPAVH